MIRGVIKTLLGMLRASTTARGWAQPVTPLSQQLINDLLSLGDPDVDEVVRQLREGEDPDESSPEMSDGDSR